MIPISDKGGLTWKDLLSFKLEEGTDSHHVIEVFDSNILANIYSDMMAIKRCGIFEVEEFFVDKELPEDIFKMYYEEG